MVSLPESTTFGSRLAEFAVRDPNRIAISFARSLGSIEHIPVAELDALATDWAGAFEDAGLGIGDLVALFEPTAPRFFAITFGAWRAGVGVLPLDPRTPAPERKAILEVARPAATVNEDAVDLLVGPRRRSPRRPRDPTPRPGKAIPSGGSTGLPKIIVDPAPWRAVPGRSAGTVGSLINFRAHQTQLVAGRLHHNAPFCWAHWGLFEGQRLLVMERFEPKQAAFLIESERVQAAFLAPTMMWQLLRDSDLASRDLSFLETIWHTAGPCPPVLKRAWLDLIGPDRLFEIYGSTEAIGITVISGREWLDHPGSVGRAVDSAFRILDDSGGRLPPGIVGEIFMRPEGRIFMPLPGTDAPTYEYVGAAPLRSIDGFESVGDLGHIDADGYLYLADRRADLIVSGGTNVYPSEVEGALLEHPEVRDAVVIGLDDEEWGKRVHAIVEAVDNAQRPTGEGLQRFLRDRIAASKIPRSWEFVDHLPRDPTYGKLRRSALRDARHGR